MPVSVLGKQVDFKRAVGKVKTRSQMMLLGTDDCRILEPELDVLKGCAVHHSWLSGWLLDSENQFQDEKTGAWYQLVGERSTIPISLLKPTKVKNLKDLMNRIFHESWTMDLLQAARDIAKEKAKAWTYIILGTPIILGALILGIMAISAMKR
jgi:hypothetical protein